jgi:hypothetical protein
MDRDTDGMKCRLYTKHQKKNALAASVICSSSTSQKQWQSGRKRREGLGLKKDLFFYCRGQTDRKKTVFRGGFENYKS